MLLEFRSPRACDTCTLERPHTSVWKTNSSHPNARTEPHRTFELANLRVQSATNSSTARMWAEVTAVEVHRTWELQATHWPPKVHGPAMRLQVPLHVPDRSNVSSVTLSFHSFRAILLDNAKPVWVKTPYLSETIWPQRRLTLFKGHKHYTIAYNMLPINYSRYFWTRLPNTRGLHLPRLIYLDYVIVKHSFPYISTEASIFSLACYYPARKYLHKLGFAILSVLEGAQRSLWIYPSWF